jgi:hypothetical protein
MELGYNLSDENDSADILFGNAEEAWFWYCKYENKSGYKRNNSNSSVARPCVLSDIYLSVARLYFSKKIKARHMRVLVKYGHLFAPPDARVVGEEKDAALWDEAMGMLEALLLSKKIVGR